MFKIGDFSKLGQVSTRMLRHYDKLGLLVPSHVDRFTGYRYYTIAQLADLHKIIALKELGLSLEQISELLKEDDLSTEKLRGMLMLKHAEINQEIQDHMMRLARVEGRLQQIEQQGKPSPYEVVIKEVPAQTIASIRQTVPYFEDLGYYCKTLHGELYQGLAQHNIEPLQPEIAMYHNDEYPEIDIDVEMAVLVKPQYQEHPRINDKIIFRELPAHAQVAALIYEGPPDNLSAAILDLLAWIGTHQYIPEPPLRELRLSGMPSKTKSRENPVVELQMSIQKVTL